MSAPPLAPPVTVADWWSTHFAALDPLAASVCFGAAVVATYGFNEVVQQQHRHRADGEPPQQQSSPPLDEESLHSPSDSTTLMSSSSSLIVFVDKLDRLAASVLPRVLLPSGFDLPRHHTPFRPLLPHRSCEGPNGQHRASLGDRIAHWVATYLLGGAFMCRTVAPPGFAGGRSLVLPPRVGYDGEMVGVVAHQQRRTPSRHRSATVPAKPQYSNFSTLTITAALHTPLSALLDSTTRETTRPPVAASDRRSRERIMPGGYGVDSDVDDSRIDVATFPEANEVRQTELPSLAVFGSVDEAIPALEGGSGTVPPMMLMWDFSVAPSDDESQRYRQRLSSEEPSTSVHRTAPCGRGDDAKRPRQRQVYDDRHRAVDDLIASIAPLRDAQDVKQLFDRCAAEGRWTTALRATECLQRHREDRVARIEEVEATLQALILAQKRDVVLRVLEHQRDVPLSAETYGSLLQLFQSDPNDHEGSEKGGTGRQSNSALGVWLHLCRHIGSTPAHWEAHPVLLEPVLRFLTRTDPPRALTILSSLLPTARNGSDGAADIATTTTTTASHALIGCPSPGFSSLPMDAAVRLAGDAVSFVFGQEHYAAGHGAGLRFFQATGGRYHAPLLLRVLHTRQGEQLALAAASRKVTSQCAQWKLALDVAAAAPLTCPLTAEQFAHHLLRRAPRDSPPDGGTGDKAEMRSLQQRLSASPLTHSALGVLTAACTADAGRSRWKVASVLLSACLRHHNYGGCLSLASVLSENGQWAACLRGCSQLLALRRMPPPNREELSLCVHASVRSGQWASALFWIERAHSRGMRFAPNVYDDVFRSRCHRWDASLRAFHTMSQVGGRCSSDGVRSLIVNAADQASAATILDALGDRVEWTR